METPVNAPGLSPEQGSGIGVGRQGVLEAALLSADTFFAEIGYSDGRMGVPEPVSADAPFFRARSAEVLDGLRRNARIELAETTARLDVLEAQMEREAVASDAFDPRQGEGVKGRLELPSRLRGVYWLFFLLILIGEVPYAYMTFSDALGVERSDNWMGTMNLLLPICGALGFVGSTAAVKVLVDWWLHRVPGKLGERWGIVRAIPMVMVVVAGAWVFVHFALGVGEFRENLSAQKVYDDYAYNESLSAGEPDHVPLPSPPVPDAAALSDSTRKFFVCFGLFFPLAAAVLGIEAEARSRRRRMLKTLERQASNAPPAEKVLRNFELEARMVAQARAEALFESYQDANVKADWHHRFWLVYRNAYLKGQYDPERFNTGPSLYEKVEAYRMKLN